MENFVPRERCRFSQSGSNGISNLCLIQVVLCGFVTALVFCPATARAQTESVLHSFTGAPTDGSGPKTGLVMDTSGNLFGTTCSGGSGGDGTIFELAKTASGYTYSVLYNLGTLSTDGSCPEGRLVVDSGDNLYGTTSAGSTVGTVGTVFELANTTGGYVMNTLYTFRPWNPPSVIDPNDVRSGLYRDSAGNLYGTRFAGGALNQGTFFEVSGTKMQVLYSFGSVAGDAFDPMSALILGPSGNFVGTTQAGGPGGFGAVFQVTSGGAESILYGFTDSGGDGAYPQSTLAADAAGNLYGTTYRGGLSDKGTIFELVNSGGTYKEKVLYSFTGTSTDGGAPDCRLVVDSSGNLYGTSQGGGANGKGLVFELVNSSGSYTFKTLYSFGNPPDAEAAYKGLARDASGNLFGTTYAAGTSNLGTVFEVSPAVASPAVTLSTTGLSFGNEVVGSSSAAKTVTLTNSGGLDLSVTSAAISGANAADFMITSDTCSGQTVAANGTCAVSVSFTPGGAGAESATLVFVDGAGDSPQQVGLTGTGIQPTVTAAPSSLTFASQVAGTASNAQTVTLTNNSAVALTIASIATTGDFAQTNDCGSSVAAGGSCTISVTFHPKAGGSRAGTLSINDNATNSPQMVMLSGVGQDFAFGTYTTARTTTPGGTSPYLLKLTPEGGFSGTVSLACSGEPSNSTCMFTPSSATLNGAAPMDVRMDIATTAPSSVAPLAPAPPSLPPLVLLIGLMGLLGLAGAMRLAPRSARVRLLAPFAALVFGVALWASCGGSAAAPRTLSGGTPSGTSTITVTATSGSLSHSTTMTLTVQ